MQPRARGSWRLVCAAGLLGCLSLAPATAGATPHLADWAAFDALMDAAIATRPDAVYPPSSGTFTLTMGLRTFDPGGFPNLTNTPPARLIGDVPVWLAHTMETNGWFVTLSGDMAVHSSAVGAYDAEAWARAKYGHPPPWIVSDPSRLAEWRFLRRRERVEMSLSLVPVDRWDDYLAALAAAAAGNPPPGEPALVPPADPNRVAFARVAPSLSGTLAFDLYTPGNLPVDIFSKTNLPGGPRWRYAGRVQAAAPFTPSAVAAPQGALFLHAARGDLDHDGDGIPDGLETLHFGTNPLLWDSSGDGLSDWMKIYLYGLDPLLRDNDGDGLPDGWEVQCGLNPLDATGDNGANGDPDGDGFANLQEFQMGGDPANPAINAAQLIHRLMRFRAGSSLRVDVEDSENCGGTNPNRQKVEDIFHVGPLLHGGYLLSLTVEGRVEDHNFGFDKVSVRSYVSTNLQSEVPFFEGNNNRNHCAMVAKQATTNVWFWSNGSLRLRYDTVDGLFHTGAYAEITAAAFVDVLKVELNAAYSDQIPSRECNALPGQNPMYMGARADNRGYLQIAVTGQPQQINNIGLVGVRHGTTILASAPIQSPRTPIDFAPAGSRELYEVVAGCDLNTDGMLQNSEVTAGMPAQLMLLTQGDYNWSWGVLNTGAFFPGVGGDLLDAFIDDTVPPGANSAPATITSADLTHPIGAQWTASCDAQTRRYTYAEGSAVSDAVETTGTVEDGLRTNLDQHQTDVQDYFTQNPTVNEHTFGPWTWAINNVEFGKMAHPSLHFAFGHVSIAGTVFVTVRRSDLKATSIRYTGSFDDIYDFDYNGAPPSIHGATVQAGFPTLGAGGRVFRTRVEFQRQTNRFDYDFN